MGLFIPNAKPRRFHLEISEREQRRQRLRQLEEQARRDMDSCSPEETSRMTDCDFRIFEVLSVMDSGICVSVFLC